MKCRRHSPVPYLEKLGGFAPEWVVLLRNRAVPEACFGVKIAILGGFAPEYLSGIVTQKLGGHAPVHATNPLFLHLVLQTEIIQEVAILWL